MCVPDCVCDCVCVCVCLISGQYFQDSWKYGLLVNSYVYIRTATASPADFLVTVVSCLLVSYVLLSCLVRPSTQESVSYLGCVLDCHLSGVGQAQNVITKINFKNLFWMIDVWFAATCPLLLPHRAHKGNKPLGFIVSSLTIYVF